MFSLLVLGSLTIAGVPFAPADTPRHQPPGTPIDFLHLQAEITVEPEKGTVGGHVTYTYRSVGTARSEVTLHAAPELHITAVKAGSTPLTFVRDDDQLRITLPAPAPIATTSQLTVTWTGRPRNGMHFVRAEVGKPRYEVWTQGETSFTRGWIPVWDYPNDRFTSALSVRVPKAYQAVANGELKGTRKDGAYVVYDWHMKHDHVAYLLSVNVGRFITLTGKAMAGPNKSEVPLQYIIYPEQKEHLRLDATAAALETLVEQTGHPYPYVRYGQTVASHFTGGGMENVTSTTLRADLAAYDDSVAAVYSADGLVVHEAAHMWFGDMVTCRDWAHIWLNEGFATYFTALYFEKTEGQARFFESLNGLKSWYAGETSGRYQRPLVTYRFERPGALFDAHTYAKGAWVVHMLRRELGDELFFKGVELYLTRNMHGLAETSDLRRAMELASGHALHDFFRQWVYTKGHVSAHVTILDKRKVNQVSLRVVQRTDAPFDFPLRVRITDIGGKTTDTVLRVQGKEQTFELPVTAAPLRVELDPELDVLRELSVTAPEPLLVAQATDGSTAQARIDGLKGLERRASLSQDVRQKVAALAKSKAEHRTVRKAAVGVLGRIAKQKARPQTERTEACVMLADVLTADADAAVRVSAAGAMGACKAQERVLTQAAKKDVSIHVRGSAAGALAKLPDPPKKLVTKALHTTSWNGIIAHATARGLVGAKAEWATDLLIDAAGQEKWTDPRSRGRVLSALAGIGRADAGVRERIRKVTIDVAKTATNGYTVKSALATLAAIGEPADRAMLDLGVERIAGKWTHKAVDRWRRTLKSNPPKTAEKPKAR